MPHKLYLRPTSPSQQHLDTRLIEDKLLNLELIEQRFQCQNQTHFYAGNRFVELVIFLGCSPAIEFTPNSTEQVFNGEGFCHIHLPPPRHQPILIGGDTNQPPRCPTCRTNIDDWQHLINANDIINTVHHCKKCNQQHTIDQLKWRKTAGIAQQFIEIWGIYPNEAVPSEELLSALRQLSQNEWDFFYV